IGVPSTSYSTGDEPKSRLFGSPCGSLLNLQISAPVSAFNAIIADEWRSAPVQKLPVPTYIIRRNASTAGEDHTAPPVLPSLAVAKLQSTRPSLASTHTNRPIMQGLTQWLARP